MSATAREHIWKNNSEGHNANATPHFCDSGGASRTIRPGESKYDSRPNQRNKKSEGQGISRWRCWASLSAASALSWPARPRPDVAHRSNPRQPALPSCLDCSQDTRSPPACALMRSAARACCSTDVGHVPAFAGLDPATGASAIASVCSLVAAVRVARESRARATRVALC